MSQKTNDANEQMQKLFEDRGMKALELARKAILEEKIESKEVKNALQFFMKRWHDIARPGLLSIVCQSIGGNPEDTTDVAIPLILIAGATDVHDDIIDESKTKYGQPTVYGKFGKNIAILTGDALFFKGLCMLNKFCARHPSIINIVKNMFFELGDASIRITIKKNHHNSRNLSKHNQKKSSRRRSTHKDRSNNRQRNQGRDRHLRRIWQALRHVDHTKRRLCRQPRRRRIQTQNPKRTPTNSITLCTKKPKSQNSHQ